MVFETENSLGTRQRTRAHGHGQREHDDEKYSRSKGVRLRAGLQINTNNLSVHFSIRVILPGKDAR